MILEKNEISSKPEILTVYVPVVSMIIIFMSVNCPPFDVSAKYDKIFNRA